MPPNTSVPPAVGAFPKKVTEVRALLKNAASPMLVTEFGIVTVVIKLPAIALTPMVVTVLGIVTEVRFCHRNALSPMVVTK